MKHSVLLCSAFLLFSVHAEAQCAIYLPVNAIPMYGYPEVAITNNDGVHWVCSGQFVTLSGNNNLVYLEQAATVHVTGNDNTVISKGGIAYYLPGNGNLLYTTLPASVVVPGNDNNVMLCDLVVFNYPVTPPPDCIALLTDVTGHINEELTVYPNPVSDRLYIDTDDRQLIRSVRIVDMQGRVVLFPLLSASRFVDLQALSAGVYTVLLSTTDGVIVRKVIKE